MKNYEAEKKKLDADLKQAKKRLEELEKGTAVDNRFVVDDTEAEITGTWKSSTLTPRYVGKGYIHDDRTGKGEKQVRYSWNPPKTADYEIRLSYTHASSRAKAVPITIRHADGTDHVVLDQTKPPTFDLKFSAVGTFRLQQETPAVVTISNAGTTGHVIADAVQFVEIDDNGKPIPQKKDDAQRQADAQKEATAALEAKLKKLKDNAPKPLPEAIAAAEHSSVGDCEICIRGEHKNRGETVPRGFLQVVSDSQAQLPADVSGRLQLAAWIADSRNPLTARVIVNRVWSHLIGEGIVRSVDNFGQLGQRPSHPELLDHLAARFVTPQGQETEVGASGFGWSIKALIREVVLSRTYQRGSRYDEASWQADPENQLLWTAHRRRLPAESLRDALLAVSGKLDLSAGGSPVQGLGTLVKTNSADADDYQREESSRRSLYLPIIRNELPPVLTVFDFADPDLVTGKRSATNVPAQALFLMNSPFVMDSADKTADLLCRDPSASVRSVIEQSYLTVLSRRPGAAEIERAREFLKIRDVSSEIGSDTADEPFATRMGRFIHVLFASTEFRMLN